MSRLLADCLSVPPTMYEHDCLSNVVCDGPQPRSFVPQVFEPLLDRLQRDIESLLPEERELLFNWLANEWDGGKR